MVFYAIAKILEYQEKRKEERQRLEEERAIEEKTRERQLEEARSEARQAGLAEGCEAGLAEGRMEGRREGIDLAFNTPELRRYSELHERIVKELEEAMEEGEREDTTGG